MTTGQMSTSKMQGVMQLVAPETASVATPAPEGQRSSDGGFSGILNGLSKVTDSEKPVTTDDQKPETLTAAVVEQQSMAAYVVAAQMSVMAEPLQIIGGTPDVTTAIVPEKASVQNVAEAVKSNSVTAEMPIWQKESSPGLAQQTTFVSTETVAVESPTPVDAKTPDFVDAKAAPAETQSPASANRATVVATQAAAVAPPPSLVASTPVVSNDSINSKAKATATEIKTPSQEAANRSAVSTSETVPLETLTPTVVKESADVVAKVTYGEMPSTVVSNEAVADPAKAASLVETAPAATKETTVIAAPAAAEKTPSVEVVKEAIVAAATKTVPEEISTSASLSGTAKQQTVPLDYHVNVQQVNNPEQPLALGEPAAPVASPPAEVEIALSQPRPITFTPSSSAKTSSNVEIPSISNSTVSRQTDLSAPVAIMPVTKTPAPVTEVTTVPSQQTQLAAVQTQTVQQDDDLMPTVVQPAQPESGGEQNSHTERAAAVTGMESTKPPIITIEPPTTEMVEQPEAAVSLLTDVARSAPVQQAVRGVAVQHATETVVENVQPRAHQASVKEMTSVQQNVVAGSEATGSGSSLGSEGEQAGSEQEKGSQTMVQQMLAQQKTEHQAAVSAKISAPPLQQTSPEQIVNQVRERLGQQELKPGHQQITLTLTPENLGEVKMNLNLQGQRLTVEIVTENRTVRDAILQHADSLKDSLARQNITMESFDVTSNGRGSGNPGDNNQNAWRELAKQQQQQQFWSSVTGGTLAPQAEVLPGQSLELTSDGRSRLDIHY